MLFELIKGLIKDLEEASVDEVNTIFFHLAIFFYYNLCLLFLYTNSL